MLKLKLCQASPFGLLQGSPPIHVNEFTPVFVQGFGLDISHCYDKKLFIYNPYLKYVTLTFIQYSKFPCYFHPLGFVPRNGMRKD